MTSQYHKPAEPTPQTESRPVITPPTARPERAALAKHHVEYLEARAVRGEARGMFWTARRPSEIPDGFSPYQRRRSPALIAEFPSPDGETVSWQKHDDNPGRDRRGKLMKWVSPPAERAPMVLAVAPSMLREVRDGTGPLWSVEGITRMAALEAFGIPAVAWAGCWNWQADGEPLRCWDYVNLRGRRVNVAMDGNWRTNENVHKALAAHVAMLEAEGALVFVVELEDGLDDALAAGADPYALERSAKPYRPVDVGRERLKRDERLRQFVALKRREVGELPASTGAECSARKVARFLVDKVAKRGKVTERGVEVPASLPEIAEGVRLGSYATVRKALDTLAREDVGFLERVPGRRRPKEATSYLLLDPWGGGSAVGVNIGTSEGGGGEGQESKAPDTRNPLNPLPKGELSPCLHSTHIPENLRKPETAVPALRSPKLVHTWAQREGRRVVVDSDYYWRYGPKREEIFRYVLEAAGADRGELHERFGSKSSRLGRFMETWVGPMLRDGVLVADGPFIFPAPDWPEALERVRARTDEDLDNRLQSQRYARRRREFHDYLERKARGEVPKADPTPELSGRERVEKMLESRRPEWERQRVEREREKVGTTAAAFVADALEGTAGVRYRELRQRWTAKGGSGEDLRRAATRSPFRLARETDGELYVYPAATPAPEREEPATVAVLHEAPPNPVTVTGLDPDDPGGDWRDHPLSCECLRCTTPEPRYAIPRSAS